MIFLSHQTNDKDFVSVIAHNLEKEYGEENVFYDEWSIKPGENIVLGMSQGIERCRYFFYFITSNSLKSNMVNLEWTSALMKMSKEDIKFIPIRAENVNPPAIISALKYLDLYRNGLDVVITQIKEIISGNPVEKKMPTFNNIVAYNHQVSANEINFYVTAKRFFEPGGRFLLVSNLQDNEAELDSLTPFMTGQSYRENIIPEEKLNGFTIDTMQDLRKGEYLKLIFRFKRIPEIVGLYKIKSDTEADQIEIIRLRNLSELPRL
ncbi:toll/interleukin-1 receptor domain-containing protein [Cytobacillus firmus]